MKICKKLTVKKIPVFKIKIYESQVKKPTGLGKVIGEDR